MRILKLICALYGHALGVVHNCSSQSQHLACSRCGKHFGIHHGVRAFVDWDAELAELCDICAFTRKGL
jgi:hypothetical protein